MTKLRSSVKGLWAPSTCTLPTVEQPLRQQQFAELFADGLTAVHRIDAVSARLELRPDPRFAARAAELSARETDCCSFFTFTLTFTDGSVVLDVSVPPTQVGVLDALIEQARTASSADRA